MKAASETDIDDSDVIVELKALKRHYILGLFLGLVLAAVCFYFLYQYFYVKILYRAEVLTVDPYLIQTANIDSIQKGAVQYHEILKTADLCPLPLMDEEAPFFSQPALPPKEDGSPALPAKTSQAWQQERMDALEGSVVLILARGETEKGEKREVFYRWATGIAIGSNYILTARRPVDDLGPKGEIKAVSFLLGQPAEAVLEAKSLPEDLQDYALLKLNLDPASQPAKLTLTGLAVPGERVMTVGYSSFSGPDDPLLASLWGGDLSSLPRPVFSQGRISQTDGQRNPPLISHSAPEAPGLFGAPLLNQKGEVLGMEASVVFDERSGRSKNVTLAAPDIQAFLSRNKINFN
ncbi:MAG: serine protease [Deltaproteobacteria bacterium]|jgi:S1-C subfamily serine protease|nr:serine protease [Deltaproteobacteria bacterium]